MPIKVPGKRNRRGRVGGGGRSAVAVLNLTAMVDMFTVLVVFLLQNFNATGEVIPMDNTVELPEAAAVQELAPSNVIVISDKGVELNSEFVTSFQEVYDDEDWLIQELQDKLIILLEEQRVERESKLSSKLQDSIEQASEEQLENEIFIERVTIQSDKKVDILSLKKIMYTATESGVEAVNFAVLKRAEESDEGNSSGH